mgnify:CR=1 FL=1
MSEKRTSVFENGLIWFGAAVSIAEILTGTYFAPLGFAKGLAAILTGHVIGCLLLFLAGYIGGKARKSAMETVKMSFGHTGGLLFCLLNVLQLVGWTGIMIYDGALAAAGIFDPGNWVWCILVGVRDLGKLNTLVMAVLFVATLVLSFLIFGSAGTLPAGDDSLSFGAAVELSVAMPLSWLPLISDYTRTAEKPGKASAVSAAVYGVVSCWMYLIGMGAALFTGESDVGQIMSKAGLGVAGLVIVVLSTVTTTFLDAYSAGVSTESLSPKIKGKWMAVAAAVLGTVGAIVFPMDNITDFLYLIGSVFAPMIGVQIADFYILHRDRDDRAVDVGGLVLWAIGFAAYRGLMLVDLPLGSTIPDIVLTVALCVVVDKLTQKTKV